MKQRGPGGDRPLTRRPEAGEDGARRSDPEPSKPKIAKAGDWGCEEVDSIPTSISSANPYNSSIDGNNLALWGITWEQDLALVDDDVPAELPDLTSIHAAYTMVESSNEPDAEDEIDTDGP